MTTAVVAGAGGFIGGHLVRSLLDDGWMVRAVDVKPLAEWHQVSPSAENVEADLQQRDPCFDVLDGADELYNLAADMGGMGFIENNRAQCMLSVLITTHLLLAAEHHDLDRVFYSSSACVYTAARQTDPRVVPLREPDAYPAMPEDGYGWEKLFGERLSRHFTEDFALTTRVARYHNVYGPHGTWHGGREKAPTAICRKVAQAVVDGDASIEIWGDGRQTRSFMYIDDCIVGTCAIMRSDIDQPVNLGSTELVTINQLVDIVEAIAGVSLERRYDLSAPQGVRGRNSDNSMLRSHLGWEPSISLRTGLEATYSWVFDQVQHAHVEERV